MLSDHQETAFAESDDNLGAEKALGKAEILSCFHLVSFHIFPLADEGRKHTSMKNSPGNYIFKSDV